MRLPASKPPPPQIKPLAPMRQREKKPSNCYYTIRVVIMYNLLRFVPLPRPLARSPAANGGRTYARFLKIIRPLLFLERQSKFSSLRVTTFPLREYLYEGAPTYALRTAFLNLYKYSSDIGFPVPSKWPSASLPPSFPPPFAPPPPPQSVVETSSSPIPFHSSKLAANERGRNARPSARERLAAVGRSVAHPARPASLRASDRGRHFTTVPTIAKERRRDGGGLAGS